MSSAKNLLEEQVYLSNDKVRRKEAIQQWLVTQVAESLRIDAMEIDVREPFASYGLSSVAALSLSADLEDWLQIQVKPTLVWDYPTFDSLARQLSDEFERALDNRQSAEAVSMQR